MITSHKISNGKILWLQARVLESAARELQQVPRKRAFPPNGTQMLNFVKSKNFYHIHTLGIMENNIL